MGQTANRGYELPDEARTIAAEFPVLRATLIVIDADMAGAYSALAGKAALVHSHVIGDVTGLQSALNAKAASDHTHALDDLTDVSGAAAAPNDYVLVKSGSGWVPVDIASAVGAHTHVIDDITGLTTALNNKQTVDADLTALAALSTTGLMARTASNTYTLRTLTGPAAGVSVSNGDGVSGNPTIALANDLAALEALASTGIAVRTTTDTWAQRSIAVTAGTGLSVTNGDGVSGNPTLAGLDATTSVKGVVEKATDAEVYAATADKFLAADHIETASAEVVLTDGASPSFDWDAGINRLWTLAANRALPNPTNGQPGTYRTIRVIGNDGTDRTLTFGTQYEGDLPTLTDIDSGKQYLLTIRCITATHFVVSSLNCSVT